MSIKAALELEKLIQEQLRETRIVRNIHTRQAPPRSKLALLMDDVLPDSEKVAAYAPRSFRIRPGGELDSSDYRTSGMKDLPQEFLDLVEERKMPDDPTDEVPTLDVERPR